MQLHVLLEATDYEGDSLLGVYGTRGDAVRAARTYVLSEQSKNPKGHSHIDSLRIETRGLDAAPVRADDYYDGTIYWGGKYYNGFEDKWTV